MRSSSATTSKEGDSVLVNHGGGTGPSGKRVWKATEHDVTTAKAAVADGDRKEDDSSTIQQQQPQHWWNESIACQEDRNVLLDRVGRQEREGGRMRQAMLGVLREDPVEDMRLLTDNYTGMFVSLSPPMILDWTYLDYTNYHSPQNQFKQPHHA
jgi:hypothetical protein